MEILLILLAVVLTIVLIVAMWKVFEKAGQPGWASIIPIYNLYIMVVIAGREWWWFVLLLIPYVNIVIDIIISIDIAKKFGKPMAFGFGLFLLPFVFYPMLAFGSDSYSG